MSLFLPAYSVQRVLSVEIEVGKKDWACWTLESSGSSLQSLHGKNCEEFTMKFYLVI